MSTWTSSSLPSSCSAARNCAGLPVVVGGAGDPTQRSVVATASYAAREFGVHSGMPMRTAPRKCPDAVFLPADNQAYEEASAEVQRVLRSFDVVVEVLGWDEAFLGADTDDPEPLARQVQAAVLATDRAALLDRHRATTPCGPSSPPSSASRPGCSG